jgi:predicted MPP superfamily phosphohydrolase
MSKRWIAVAFLLVIAALGAWAFWLEPASLKVQEHTLNIPRWPRSLDGLRIAVLADLHTGSPFNGVAKLQEIVAATNNAKPDLILIPGDLMIQKVFGGTQVAPEEIAARLASLKAPLGVWATLGNHDWWFDATRVRSSLEQHGIKVLEDANVQINRRHSSFWLAGIGDFWEGKHDVAAALANIPFYAPIVAVTHNPDVFPFIPDNVSILIASHTHGGQVWLPLIGRPIVPSDYGQRYAVGHVVENGRHLFVSTGLGTSIIPVRFLVPPEISVVILKSQ